MVAAGKSGFLKTVSLIGMLHAAIFLMETVYRNSMVGYPPTIALDFRRPVAMMAPRGTFPAMTIPEIEEPIPPNPDSPEPYEVIERVNIGTAALTNTGRLAMDRFGCEALCRRPFSLSFAVWLLM